MADTSRSRRRGPAASRRRVLKRVYADSRERPRWLETRLLRAGEVAALLQVSRRSIATWAQRGLLPYIETPGGHRRFRAVDVRALIGSLKHVGIDVPIRDAGPDRSVVRDRLAPFARVPPTS